MNYDLPETVTIDDIEYKINADFRDIINIFNALNDDELTDKEKTFVLLNNFYVDDIMGIDNLEEAVKKAIWFMDWGKDYKDRKETAKLIDWEQDYNLIISAVNTKAKTVEDVRQLPFLHWWTFLSMFSERDKCRLSTIIELRDKLAKGQKLEKWEKQTLRENRDEIILTTKADEKLEKELWG